MPALIEGTPTVIADGGSYTAEESGSNRLVVFAILVYGSVNHKVSAVDWGALSTSSEIIFQERNTGSARTVSCTLAYVKEADIPVGANNLSVTVNAGTIVDSACVCYTVSGVDQTTPVPVGGSDSVFAGFGSTETISGIVSAASGLAISCGIWAGGDSSFTEAPDDSGYSNDYEDELNPLSGGPAGAFHKATTGANESVTYTELSSNHGVAIMNIAPSAPSGPSLSVPTAASPTSTSVTPTVTTDTAEGTLYMVLVPDGDDPSIAQIKAGQQESGADAIASDSINPISAIGEHAFVAVTGLDIGVAYELFFVHTDDSANDSARVSAGFSTLAAEHGVIPQVDLTLTFNIVVENNVSLSGSAANRFMKIGIL